ncbi:protein dachsous-like [Branchiostoma floridae]|uniref:Protein dachsous-like n=1 Tax=Branchiostoma floridae TaxID=7739 RepID=A0A9J7LNV2_BRAFL|nr:protein dachsous-like [Branchiostoma floridae]
MSRRNSRTDMVPPCTFLVCLLLLLHPANSQSHEATFQTEEGQAEGTYIGNIVEASGITGPFYLSPDPSDTQLLQHLSIDEHTGVIRSGLSLDRETRDFYELLAVSTSQGQVVTVKVQVTDINDNAPEFVGSYTPSLTEAAPIGTSVFQLTAQDRDIGVNAEITFSILSTPGTHSDWFNVDPASGLIMTRVIVDREIDPSPRITIDATDHGTPAMSTTIQVTVTLLDFNDNEPLDQVFYSPLCVC